MHPAGLREEGAPLQCLDHEVVGDVAREAQVDRRVDERLHDQEDVCGAGPADGGRHGDELLVVDRELQSQRAEERAGLRALELAHLRRRVPDGHPATQLSGRVGHAPHQLPVPQDITQRSRRGPGDDADHELPAAQHGCQLPPHAPEHLRLDGQDHDVGALDGLHVRLDGLDAMDPAELLPPLGARVARDDPLRPDLFTLEQARDHGLGHDARADRGDGAVAQGHEAARIARQERTAWHCAQCPRARSQPASASSARRCSVVPSGASGMSAT